MGGWQPLVGVERRKDFRRSAERAVRLRRDVTPSEARAWKLLRLVNREDGANFRRQAHVGEYVFDFADLSRRILVEVDGGVHDLPETQIADAKKEASALARGYTLVRFTNEEVWSQPQTILKRLRAFPSPNGGGVGVGGVQKRLQRTMQRNEKKLVEGQRLIGRPLPLPPPQGEGNETGEHT
jgi:very-short-patch-repair endonuclease